MAFSPRLGFLLAAALLCAGESRAQPFANGGFEIVTGAPIPPGDSQVLNPGDTWIPGWSAGGPDGSVMVQNGIVGFFEGQDLFGLDPFEGQQWLIFPDDVSGGSVSQTFTTAVGSYCSLSFVSAYVFTADNPLLDVTVQAGGGSVLTNSPCALSFCDWTSNQLSFIATTTNTTLIFSDVSAGAEGAYLAVDDVVLVAEPPGWPYILTSPQDETNAAGTPAIFTASAGGLPSTVQWYLGTNAVPGATNATLTFLADETNAGSYTAVFSNSLGTNATQPAVLTVLQVDTSPISQSANAGALVQFSAVANLSTAKVQWFLGPNLIPGATSPLLQVTAGNQSAGSYTAQFSLGKVTTTSAAALLVVSNIPFTNESFEQTSGVTIPPGNDQLASVGDTWLTGWDIGGTNDEVFVFNGPFLGLTAADGAQWVVFDAENGPPGGVLSQTFSTIIGQSYLVTFASVAVIDEGSPFKSLTVSATASDGSLLAGNEIEPPTDWATNQLTFVATTINTTLAFTDTSAPSIGPSVALDAVTVTAETTGGSGPGYSLAPLALQSSAIVLRVSGPSGQSFILETSTNLANWSPVLTNDLSGPATDVTNALILGASRQFWRAIAAP